MPEGGREGSGQALLRGGGGVALEGQGPGAIVFSLRGALGQARTSLDLCPGHFGLNVILMRLYEILALAS